MRVTAGEHERFAPGSWDSQVGKTVPFKVGERSTEATVIAVRVADDGNSVAITVELPDAGVSATGRAPRQPNAQSFSASLERAVRGDSLRAALSSAPALTPHAALRKLEALLASTDAPKAKIDEAESYFRVLWKRVMLGPS
jgi:hypothetical protein